MSPSLDTRENREFASEIKFLVSPLLAGQIRDWARARLAPDPNAGGQAGDGYHITSLYFDTAQFDVFHRRGSFGRSKYRIRRYGQSEIAFLERKLRTRGLLAKRRSIAKLDELERLADAAPERNWTGFWFHRRLQARGLEPVCQISYDCIARVAMTRYGPIRLTLDNNLRALPVAGLCFNDQEGAPILQSRIILELKFRYEMPVLFKNLAEEFALNSQPFSKKWLDWDKLGPLAQQYQAVIAEDVRKDTRKLYSSEAFSKGVLGDAQTTGAGGRPQESSLKSFAEKRRAYLLNNAEVKKAAP